MIPPPLACLGLTNLILIERNKRIFNLSHALSKWPLVLILVLIAVWELISPIQDCDVPPFGDLTTAGAWVIIQTLSRPNTTLFSARDTYDQMTICFKSIFADLILASFFWYNLMYFSSYSSFGDYIFILIICIFSQGV